ncbi:hypothetical protein D1BOALGB6SA_6973 [Olavius sp. associated proteobacterium Delta 1]|nr:hypothetical protein D1BOALGB6SA_6973 [Olavius sp. associated proteobacterium Delta 1]
MKLNHEEHENKTLNIEFYDFFVNFVVFVVKYAFYIKCKERTTNTLIIIPTETWSRT